MLPAQPNQSLIDGLTVLQALAVTKDAVGGRALARQLNLEPTRVNRLLKTLAYLGMARQTPNRKYLPGPAMHVLAAQSLFGSGLIRRALPLLEGLQRHGHVVALGVLWRDQVCYLYHWEPGETSASALGRLNLYPASQSSIGRMLLAWQDEQVVRELYQDREIPLYPAGIEDLLADLRLARVQGYAYAVQRPEPLLASAAVPVGLPPYAAIALGGQVAAEMLRERVAALKEAAAKLETGKPKTATL
ncbi:MAG TPA: IclR family transcriptional regulator C-terminal domain-containing protein [Tepidisphaeraceae bacterium]|jgi:DNA-binding IclR family transcriptional regulator